MKTEKITKTDKNKSKTKFALFLKEYWMVLALFAISTLFFIYQHYVSVGWDFITYVLNGQYWFSDGKYFELLRPPLMPFMMGIFSIFGWKMAEYIFIMAVSALFAYSSVKLAKTLKFHPAAFYAISLNFFLLVYGLINGTELLSVALLELFLVLLFENKSASGFLLGLSALARYTSLALFPLILFHLNMKKIIKSLLFFAGTLAVWFAYNFYKTGNFFTSIADQFANNILYREYLIAPMKFTHILAVQNILLPFVVIGLVIIVIRTAKTSIQHLSAKSDAKSNWNSFLALIEKTRIELVMTILLVLSIVTFGNIPIKHPRYLFSLLLPTFYFAYVGLRFLYNIGEQHFEKENSSSGKSALTYTKIMFVLFSMAIAAIFLAAMIASSIDYDPPEKYKSAVLKMNELNLSSCSVQSNSWPALTYYQLPSLPFPSDTQFRRSIENGNIIILFKSEPEPTYVHNESFINNQPIIFENDKYVIIGLLPCKDSVKYSKTYLEQVKDVLEPQGVNLNINPCIIMFHNIPLLERTCNFVNFNGFTLDENREYT